jgi:hypothetical protein
MITDSRPAAEPLVEGRLVLTIHDADREAVAEALADLLLLALEHEQGVAGPRPADVARMIRSIKPDAPPAPLGRPAAQLLVANLDHQAARADCGRVI